ncbi:hypothetical protein NEHOM01_2021 [Nematocida homosporus]|uniref:uncharacterized protein n=1 Tax=Nematocida homosporus TaxID=1912981 RepID=UPI00221E5675|nr:uncharacterized protein NEHOM01_2021 [Nematocida homosporus]KAI5187223.1 hypothetical protein NEHOM01_2021 [Nematocida homosporus]
MGIILGRRKSVREIIIELETKIEKEEKEIKSMKQTRNTLDGTVLKLGLLVIFVGCALIWICKESVSWSSLVKILILVVIAILVLLLVSYLLNRVYEYRLQKRIKRLQKLKEVQRSNILSLKKETKYDETHHIIEKYERPKVVEEEKPENVVEKIVSTLIQ